MISPSLLSSRKKLALLALTAAIVLTGGSLRAQQLYVSDMGGNTVSTYTLDGTPIDQPLVNNLSNPFGVAVSGNTLYVANYGLGTLATYNASTGAGIGSNPLISGLSNPADILVSGNTLYVTNMGNGTVDAFNATTGSLLGGNPLISGLTDNEYLALAGNNLYVSTFGAIYEYNATTGAMVGSGPLVSGLTNARGIAVNGNDLYVADASAGTVTVYDATTGSQIGANPLITGLADPRKVAFYDGDLYVSDVAPWDNSIMTYDATTGEMIVSCWYAPNAFDFTIAGGDPIPVPEPSTWALIVAGIAMVIFVRRSRASAKTLSLTPTRAA